jgi:hypothetical protein
MNKTIEQFIKESFIEDKSDVLLECFEIFDLSNLNNHENEFMSLLMEYDNLDRITVLSDFESLAVTNLCFILINYGIKVAEETPLSMLNHICRGMADLEYYTGVEDVLKTIETDMDSEEKLSQILEYVTGIDEQLILTYLETVNPSMVDKINDLFSDRVNDLPEDFAKQSADHKLISTLRDMARFLGQDNIIGFNLIKAGVLVNASFSNYIRYFEHHLDDMSVQEAAKELLVLLTMSSEGYSNVLKTYSEHSTILFHDLDKISKVFSELSRQIMLFDRYMIQRSTLRADSVKGSQNE